MEAVHGGIGAELQMGTHENHQILGVKPDRQGKSGCRLPARAGFDLNMTMRHLARGRVPHRIATADFNVPLVIGWAEAYEGGHQGAFRSTNHSN